VTEVFEVAGPRNIPIIGQGGIASATDAIEFLLAGATAVGVGTALFYDPLVCRAINAGLAAYLARHALASPRALTGALQLPAAAAARCG
jgi:dihydroorotate dehydrogenase (NAD+) catalytic subunit